jgi:hypothetical protein
LHSWKTKSTLTTNQRSPTMHSSSTGDCRRRRGRRAIVATPQPASSTAIPNPQPTEWLLNDASLSPDHIECPPWHCPVQECSRGGPSAVNSVSRVAGAPSRSRMVLFGRPGGRAGGFGHLNRCVEDSGARNARPSLIVRQTHSMVS